LTFQPGCETWKSVSSWTTVLSFSEPFMSQTVSVPLDAAAEGCSVALDPVPAGALVGARCRRRRDDRPDRRAAYKGLMFGPRRDAAPVAYRLTE